MVLGIRRPPEVTGLCLFSCEEKRELVTSAIVHAHCSFNHMNSLFL